MKLSAELQWRGLIYQTTIQNFSIIDENKVVFYHGFDASAPSQTIGNLASMMLDRVFLRHGHTGIVLAGGATSLVGDAGGKDTERELQSVETITHNIACAEKQLRKVYGEYDFTLVNNIDWTRDISMLDFLRDVGKYYNISDMIKKDIVVNRIGEGGSGISYAEFSYSLLQGNDYLHLFDNYKCTLQLCGADQWTNCLSGVELIRRKRGAEVHVLTNPLIINHVTGKKFGKSEGGAVWLDERMTSPYEFYQFWMNTDDIGCREYVKIYTDIMPDDYDQLIAEAEQNPSERLVQKYLAYHVTKLVHGQDSADTCRETAEKLFGGEIDINDPNIPQLSVSEYIDNGKLDLVELLASSGAVKSKREAREFIDAGSISMDDEKFSEYSISLDISSLPNLIRVGKKKHYRLVV
jgi:tyrosyl-tRNA synthetase